MRVLHLSPGPEVHSGIAQYGSSFRQVLREAGAHVEHMHVPLDHGELNSLRDIAHYSRQAVRRAPSFDVVHAELGGGALREFYAAWAVSRGDQPVVVTVHDSPRPVWFPWHVDAVRRRQRTAALVRRVLQPASDRLEQAFLERMSDICVTTSAATRSLPDRYARASLPPIRELAYPLLQPPGAIPQRPPDAPLRIAYLGHWYPGKGIERLVRAVALAHSQGSAVSLRLFGDVSLSAGVVASTAYKKSVLRLILELRMQDVVSVEGYLDDQDLKEALLHSDVVALAYDLPPPTSAMQLTSTSAAAHDALGLGLPVLCTPFKAIQEIVQHGVNGLVVEASVSTFATAISELAHDTALRERLSTGAVESGNRLFQASQAAGSGMLATYRALA